MEIDPRAEVHSSASVGSGSRVWALAQIRELAEVGDHCTIGRGAYVGAGVKVGANTKIQNFAQIFEPSIIHDGVFIGPNATLTNDTYPRSITVDGRTKTQSDWNPAVVEVHTGASIGAGAVCVAPLQIGRWALVGAGAVVTQDVKAYSMVVGIPARHVGWVGRLGFPLFRAGEVYRCPQSSDTYRQERDSLVLIEDTQT